MAGVFYTSVDGCSCILEVPFGFPSEFLWASLEKKAFAEEHATISARIASANMHNEHA
jgi:hypothetical protein